MNKIYKVGIIGAGSIVENSHIPVLKNNKNISIVWLYDSNIERSTLVSKMYGIAVIKESMLENAFDEIDICLLAVPYGARIKYFELCAQKQKALYVEKPFAKTIKEHEQYCAMFPATDMAIGFQRRYYNVVDKLNSIINSEIFGDLKNIKFSQGYFTIKGGSSYLSDAKMSGGGVIIESAIHVLDQILIATNAIDVTLSNIKSLYKNGIDYDTVFSSEISTLKGTVTIDCEISSIQNLENILELHFENTIVKCKLLPDAEIITTGKNKEEINFNIQPQGHNRKQAASVNESFYIFWNEFINSLNSKEENLTSAKSSLLTTSWIEQIYKNIKVA